jgi:hypothetical protein
MVSRMLKRLAPLFAAVAILASAAAHAQLGAGSLNPGMPGLSSPPAGIGFSPGATSPGMPIQAAPGVTNPLISNYGAGGMQRVPGSPPRFH